MRKKYIILPSGFSPDNVSPSQLEELHHRENDGTLNEENAEIIIYKNGIEQARVPYSKRLAKILVAEIPEVPVRITEGGETKREILGRPEPPDLRRGYPPIRQLLIKKCGYKGLGGKEINELIFDSLGWFPNTQKFKSALNKDINDLLEQDLLAKTKDGKIHTGFAELEGLGKEGYPIESGPYPVIRLIRDKCAEKGRMSRLKLVDIIYAKWYWTSTRPSADFWIDKALEDEFIREVEDDVFEPHKRIEV